jgi:putative redox protein
MARGIAHIGRDTYQTRIEVSGHQLSGDEPERNGGKNTGPAPYDFLLAGLGACTAITLRMYADRKQWPLESVDVALHIAPSAEGPLAIKRELSFSGALDAEQTARLAEIAEKTPVTLTLKAGLPITTTVRG